MRILKTPKNILWMFFLYNKRFSIHWVHVFEPEFWGSTLKNVIACESLFKKNRSFFYDFSIRSDFKMWSEHLELA